jgi:guanylate kinase
MEAGHIVINEIDLHGVRSLSSLLPKESRTVIYIDAGDWETLKARALSRAPMSEKELLLRHVHYLEETAYKHNADFIIQNNDNQLEDAKREISTIVSTIISRT